MTFDNDDRAKRKLFSHFRLFSKLLYSPFSTSCFMKVSGTLFLILISIIFFSCQDIGPRAKHTKPSFQSVTGIRFTEVRRSFDSGLSFDERGYQLEPSWRLMFHSDDTVEIYTPAKERFMNYKIYFDHDSVINMGWVWLRLKHTSKDSVVFQVLSVEKKEISRERSNVYMTLYADQYIEKVLHSKPQILQKPNRKDSIFVRSKISDNTGDHTFAARKPVMLKSKSWMLEVEKLKVMKDKVDNLDPTDEYLYPEFHISIKKAYKDFDYSFSILVDEKGKMHFGKSMVMLMPEFEESRKRIMMGIMEVYLQNLLEITPGSTLGMPHTSTIVVNVKGRKG